ncbi:MAG: hypothetical protein F3745_08045 [Nitrospinae bacterium]|nr:hypothetical protein [Nitrospinota bacterium]
MKGEEMATYDVNLLVENHWEGLAGGETLGSIWVLYHSGKSNAGQTITNLAYQTSTTIGPYTKTSGWDSLTISFTDGNGNLWGTDNLASIYTNNKAGTIEVDIHSTLAGLEGYVLVTSQDAKHNTNIKLAVRGL